MLAESPSTGGGGSVDPLFEAHREAHHKPHREACQESHIARLGACAAAGRAIESEHALLAEPDARRIGRTHASVARTRENRIKRVGGGPDDFAEALQTTLECTLEDTVGGTLGEILENTLEDTLGDSLGGERIHRPGKACDADATRRAVEPLAALARSAGRSWPRSAPTSRETNQRRFGQGRGCPIVSVLPTGPSGPPAAHAPES